MQPPLGGGGSKSRSDFGEGTYRLREGTTSHAVNELNERAARFRAALLFQANVPLTEDQRVDALRYFTHRHDRYNLSRIDVDRGHRTQARIGDVDFVVGRECHPVRHRTAQTPPRKLQIRKLDLIHQLQIREIVNEG